jgi:integrase
MANVNFNLKDKKAKGKTLVFLNFNYDNKRVKISTGISVHPKNWNENNMRVKEHMTIPEHSDSNEKLDNQRNSMMEVYRKFEKEGYFPEPKILKNEFLTILNNPIQTKTKKDFWGHFDDFIEYKKKSAVKTIGDYDKALRKHLKGTEDEFKKSITFEYIKKPVEGFVDDLDFYLNNKCLNAAKFMGLKVNTIGKQHKNLKVFLNWCFDSEIYPRFNLSHIKTFTEESDAVYLTQEEVNKIKNKKLNDENENLVRDVFLIGVETALRYVDLCKLTKENIKGEDLHIIPSKQRGYSNKKLIIPISSTVKSILKKYNNIPPNYPYNKSTLFIKTIQKIAERCEINEEFTFVHQYKDKKIATTNFKYNLITTHTCRRSFVTLKYYAKKNRMPTAAIMKFSGHSTERGLLRYLKMDNQETADKYRSSF